jgi:hypothetical protein
MGEKGEKGKQRWSEILRASLMWKEKRQMIHEGTNLQKGSQDGIRPSDGEEMMVLVVGGLSRRRIMYAMAVLCVPDGVTGINLLGSGISGLNV